MYIYSVFPLFEHEENTIKTLMGMSMFKLETLPSMKYNGCSRNNGTNKNHYVAVVGGTYNIPSSLPDITSN